MDEDYKIIESLEIELTRSDIRKNKDRLTSLLCDDFQEFGKSGKVYSKPEIISSLANEEPTVIEFIDFSFVKLSENSVLVKYKSYSNGIRANRSSIWVKRINQWQLLHHQGTQYE